MFSIFSKFKNGLQKTAVAVNRKIAGLFTGNREWTEEDFAELEKTLIGTDLGMSASRTIVQNIRERYKLGELKSSDDISRVAAAELKKILSEGARPMRKNPDGVTVLLFVGVNGSGKTTTIGKLAAALTQDGNRVMLGACDTFRAAAVEQLTLWAERTGSQIVAAKQGADPASVAFDAVKSAVAKGVDYLLIDTAGRQQNRKNLMDELAKVTRIINKVLPGAPHETILTIDASHGSNSIAQAREFASISGASAMVLTKMDGTGKGGAACAAQREFGLPILFVGLGEQPDDLQVFDPETYANAIFPPDAGAAAESEP